jgi:hypothetical protein
MGTDMECGGSPTPGKSGKKEKKRRKIVKGFFFFWGTIFRCDLCSFTNLGRFLANQGTDILVGA